MSDILPSDSRAESTVVPAAIQLRDRTAASAGLGMLASVFVPGLGQALRHRWVPAMIHFGAVASYLVMVQQAGWGRAGWLALAWNLWSGIDAFWHEHRNSPPLPPDDVRGIPRESSVE